MSHAPGHQSCSASPGLCPAVHGGPGGGGSHDHRCSDKQTAQASSAAIGWFHPVLPPDPQSGKENVTNAPGRYRFSPEQVNSSSGLRPDAREGSRCTPRVPGDHRRQCRVLDQWLYLPQCRRWNQWRQLPRLTYMDKRALAVLAGLLASGVVACGNPAGPGSGPGGGPGGSASPPHASGSSPARPQGGTPSQPASKPAGLTAADNGKIVRLTAGQSITVTLVPAPPFSWHLPAATGGIIQRTDASGGYPERKPARAAFRAAHPGRAILSAIDDAQCLHAPHPCMLPQRSWHVMIIVTQP